MLKRHWLLLFTICWWQLTIQAQSSIIPRPVAYRPDAGVFVLDADTRLLLTEPALAGAAQLLQRYVQEAGVPVAVAASSGGNAISLKVDSNRVPDLEGYLLQVTSTAITLTGHDLAGVLHGIQSLRQLWQPGNARLRIPACEMTDHPRFGYRSMALDVSRHFFSIDFLQQYIDLLALYKFNTFHWHLTDDQGWRIEIKKYPRLQSVAAWRSATLIGHKKETPHRFDGKRYGGYYTQQEVKQLVRYAAQRGITIIPEIEMPGHALAALAAYPQLGCTGGPYAAARFWGVFDDVFCAGNDSVFTFLQDVLDEVMYLFPSTRIHIGGDECPKTRWQQCARCQQRMKALSLKDEHALQSWFVQRIEQYLNSRDRQIIGWDEILEGGLAPNATVMSWRGEEGGLQAAQQRHPVIMTPETHVYFDYYQSRRNREPVAAGHYTPLQKVYSYRPAATLADSLQRYIIGLEGQAWSEYLVSEQQARYMIFPRAMALAEVAWSPDSLRQYDHFLSRLRGQTRLLQQYGITADNRFDEVVLDKVTTRPGAVLLTLSSTAPEGAIRYTLDGSMPGLNSLHYTQPVVLTRSATLKAQAFDRLGRAVGSVLEQPVTVHKATGAAVQLTNKPLARWDPGSEALVNGIQGTHRYNDAQWLGFSGSDGEAIIDLGSEQSIGQVRMNWLNYHWQRIWAPVVLEIAVADEGKSFKTVFTQTHFGINGINPVKAVIGTLPVRYIRIKAINKGLLPPGEYGAGSQALLMIDEVIVE
ncbi:family 20 glycosylhydrolase [Paraflavitalea pollutisoli]|uniref:glycoside hydrolase family 20 protein n=1 Tax=Paraflavitalea pollutisoli TaxID=3034143 RepID=UPI0023EC5F9E|nr:family 20 glycosylhydrolase [Paraflavitalea sp. H1-2-19X]